MLGGKSTAPCPSPQTLGLVHDPAYVQSFLNGTISPQAMRRIGLAWSRDLVRRTLAGVGSVVLAARLALQFGVACTTNGGTHHAHHAHGSGWCIFNDCAVAARAAQRDAGVDRVLILDLDVHQGDGTATIFCEDPTVFTLSIHCGAQPFPAALASSDLDVALPIGTGDAQYLTALQEALNPVLECWRPQLIFYNAGADVHKDDMLGLLALTDAGVEARDRQVLEACARAGVPVAAVIGGGYDPDHARLVERHLLLHRAAADLMPLLGCNGRAARRTRTATAQ